MADAPARDLTTGEIAAAISNLTVHLLNEYTGRGPVRARTHLEDDLVTVVLNDTLTKGERSLVRDGEEEHVLETRRAYQRTMREELTEGVERITGREVIAFMSANHVEPDVAVEVFVLAPAHDG